ncbi:ABC transporter permease [Haloechinothrix sp. LS1_15]|uniref:ABC transporter permease n=1 Tax=Haloechinothrix sp. LS1_15 TaxID=2652248 RepID=UPI002944F6E6|nr:ABC transporter permease [Haloechinothrix sp. LS1_15]MDV6011606.1 ABC transporter permease [Haloechinothrix sp. LS1_15]
MTGLPQMTVVEAKMVWRDPAGLLIPLGLPLLILLMHGMGGQGELVPEFGGLSGFDAVAVPIALTMILAIVGMVNLPSFLAGYRKHGVLRRLSVTPAKPAALLLAQVLVNLGLATVGLVVALAVARLAFDLSAPRELGWAALALVLGAAAMYAVGMLIAALAPSVNAAIAIGLVAFLGTMAAGGGFLPAEHLPGWLATAGEFTPYGAALQALRDAWIGEAPQVLHLAALAGVTVLAVSAAARLFRWE